MSSLVNIVGKGVGSIQNDLGSMVDVGSEVERVFKKAAFAVGSLFGASTAMDFAKQIFNVRSEIQSLEISFETLLGSKEKADELFGSIREFAVQTPMQLKDLASAAQLLLSFNISQDKIMPYLKALGDVSMGDAQKFNSLSLAFAQMSSAGKLMGQDLMQMINAGFNPLSVMAEKTGKSISELKDEMSAGKITAEMVQQAFIDATSEGGKYNNMLLAQSKSLQGSMSNLQGAVDDMLNDLGTMSEDVFADLLSGATSIVKNYKEVAEILAVLIGVYGTYKAAVMATEAVQRSVAASTAQAVSSSYAAEIASIQAVVTEKAAETEATSLVEKADLDAAVAKETLTQAQATEVLAARESVVAKQQQLAEAVALAEAELAEATAVSKASALKLQSAELQVEMWNRNMLAAQENMMAEEELRAIQQLGIAVDEQQTAAIEAKTAALRLQTAQQKLATAQQAQSTFATQADTIATGSNTAATGLLATAKTRLISVVQKLYATMKAHPYALLLAAVVALGYGIYKLITYQTEAEKAQKKLNETMAKSEAAINAEQRAIKQQFDTLKSLEKGTKQYEAVKDNIIKQYGDYLKGLVNEKNELIDVAAAYKRVADAARDAARARALSDATQQASDTYQEQTNPKLAKIQEIIEKRAGKQADALWQIVKNELENGEGVMSDNTRKMMLNAFGVKKGKGSKRFDSRAYDGDVSSILNLFSEVRGAQDTLSKSMEKAQKVYGDAVNEFIGYTNEELDAIREQIKSETDFTNAKVYLHGKEIKSINSVAEAQLALDKIYQAKKQNNANAPAQQTTLADDYAKAQKTWQDAKEKVAEMDANRSKYTAKEYEAATAELKAAKEKFEKLGGVTKSDNSQSKLDKLDEKQAIQDARSRKDLEMSAWEARINAMEDGEAKTIEQMRYNHEREKIELQREKEDYIQAKIDAERQKFEADPKNKGKKFNSSGIGLTDDEQSQFDAKAESMRQKQMREEAEFLQSSVDSMRQYLAQYGTFQQQKLAIAEEYAEKIRKATTEGERLSLEKERDQKIASAQVQSIKDSIDWAVVFGEFGSMFADVITPELDKARQLASSDEFKATASVEDIKALNDAIRQMEQAVGTTQVSFDDLGRYINAYQAKQQQLNEATAVATQKQEAYEKAVSDLEKADNDTAKMIAQARVKQAQEELTAANEVVDGLTKECGTLQDNISATAQALQTAEDKILQGAQQMASGSFNSLISGTKSVADGLQSLSKVSDGIKGIASKISSAISNMPGWVGIAASLLEVFKDGITDVFTSVIDSLLGSINNILSDILSGDIITQTGKSLLSGIGNIFNTISFGGFKSLFGNSNAKEVAEILERNTQANEILTDALNNLKDEISGGGQKSVKAYQEAVELQKKINDNTLEKAQAQAGYHGSHHSWNYYMGGDTEQAIKSAIREITNGLLGQDWSDIWELTPEQMQQLLSDPDLVDAIKNLGKGGYGEQVYEYLKEYADQAGQLEDLKEQLYEALTTYSFDSMVDEFTSSLMDMSKSASDFSEDFSKMMMQSMLNNKIADLMDSDLQAFYDKWAQSLENKTIENDIDSLQEDWDAIVQKGLEYRDSIAAITGYDQATSQNSSKGGFAAMSQDTADELNGRFTALQMSGVAIENTLALMLNDTTATRTAAFLIREQCDELLNVNMLQLTELEAISKNTKELYTMNQRLEKIEQNTSQL